MHLDQIKYTISANLAYKQAMVKKKIFKKERVINNIDKTMMDMRGYPFFIPSNSDFGQTSQNNNVCLTHESHQVLSSKGMQSYNQQMDYSPSITYKDYIDESTRNQNQFFNKRQALIRPSVKFGVKGLTSQHKTQTVG